MNKSFGLFHPVSEFFLYILFISFVTKQKWVYKRKKKIETLRIVSVSSFHLVTLCFVTSSDQGCRSVSILFTLFISNFLVCFILFQSFSYISYSFYLLQNRNEFIKKKGVCFIVSLIRNENITNFWVCFILFQRFSYISYSFHFLRNRNGFIKKKDVCFIVSFRFTLFRNEHISNFLVCFILFQSFSYISYSFHLLRNRNGFIKKKDVCFIVSFRFILFRNRIEQVFWSVSSCFRVFPIYLIRFICYEIEMGLLKKYICFIISLCFTLFLTSIDHGFWSVSSCFRVFSIYLNHFICYKTEIGL